MQAPDVPSPSPSSSSPSSSNELSSPQVTFRIPQIAKDPNTPHPPSNEISLPSSSTSTSYSSSSPNRDRSSAPPSLHAPIPNFPPPNASSRGTSGICGRFPSLPICGCTIPCRVSMNEVHPILVAPAVYLGPVQAAYKVDELRSCNITHVLNLACMQYTEHPQFTYHSIEIDDAEHADIARHFQITNRFIERAVQQNGGVLVHCNACVSRSPTVVIAYLMWKHGMTLDDAMARVKSVRHRANPNAGFMKQLRIYEMHLQEARTNKDGSQSTADSIGE